MEISRLDAAIEHAVTTLAKSDAVIDQISDEYLAITVSSPQDNAGFETASTALKRMVRLRNQVEKTRKELKADSVRYGKAVDGEAKRIQGLIKPIEDHLKEQADVVRLEQKRLEVEAENKRREEVRSWIAKLNDIGAAVNPDALNAMTAEDFDWHFRAAKSEADKRKEAEAEVARRVEAERLELEALRKEAAKLRAELIEIIPGDDLIEAAREQRAEHDRVTKSVVSPHEDPSLMTQAALLKLSERLMLFTIPNSLTDYEPQIMDILKNAACEIRGLV
jgi:vacuolar-type H+-ATPase subunit I/STV1